MATPKSSTQRGGDMRAVGMSIGEMNQRNLAERRHKKGECPTCGNKTHKIGLFGKRTALTIEGSCLYGRCLLCYPVEGYTRRPDVPVGGGGALPPGAVQGVGQVGGGVGVGGVGGAMNPHNAHPHHAGVVHHGVGGGGVNNPHHPHGYPHHPQQGPPQPMHVLPVGPNLGPNFVIETEAHDIPDDGTMVSGITMDHRLIVGARNWNGEVIDDELYEDDDSFEAAGDNGFVAVGRPEPSVGGMDDMKPPERRRPSRGDDHSAHSSVGPGGGGERGGRPSGPPKRYASHHEDAVNRMDQVGMDIVPPTTNERQRSHRKVTAQNNNNNMASNNSTSGGGGGGYQRPPTVKEERSVGGRSSSGPSSVSGDRKEIRFQAPRYPNESGEFKSSSDPFTSSNNRGGSGEEKVELAVEQQQQRGGGDHHSRPWEQEYALNSSNHESATSRGGGGAASRPSMEQSPAAYDSRGGGGGGTDFDLRAMDRGTQFRRQQSEQVKSPVTPIKAEALGLERARSSIVGGSGSVASRSPRQNARSSENSAASGHKSSSSPQQQPPPPAVASLPPLQSRRGLPDEDFTEGPSRRPNVRKPSSTEKDASVSVDDISEIIDSLDHTNRVRGFQSLAELIMAHGQTAKIRIREHEGIPILVESMWTDMTDASVMEAACELLFALTASSDGNPDSDMLVGDSADGAVDALLITMQTHIGAESIQQSGCGTLHCLASASSTNPHVPDGTLSGAVFTVVNAMDMHRQSQEVQEWGIRALYSQCMLSTHAESNKKNLAQSGQDGGGGMGVIRQAMETANSDLVTVELACRLYWSLAANEDVARGLMETPSAFTAVVDALDRYHKKPEAAPMMEAAFGALANLARVCDNQHLFRDSDVIEKATRSIQAFHYDESLYIEACALLGVLATDRRNSDLLATMDCVNAISKLMHHYSHNIVLQEEALWALVCLTNGSEQGKLALSSEAMIGSIVRIMRDRKSSSIVQELTCTLIGSLCVVKESAQVAVTNGVIDTVLALLKAHPNERKIHEAAFVTLRNITSQGTGVDFFLKSDTAMTLMNAMASSNDSVSAQLNACCMLWNICAKAKKDPSGLVDAGAIAQVVKAMQTHMESGDVLEMACGALWCLIDQSDSRKKELLGCGAIDAVTCSLVMHPKEPATLEKACGLLANVCTSTHMAEAIADSQGISMVVEAMANNASSMKLLELGTLVLRNMVLTNHEFAMEASNGISAVINCMKDNPDAVGFQREACNTLWALAAQSEECKNKILALDGVTVLMGALEHNSCVGDVQDAARGAINQLALSGPGM